MILGLMSKSIRNELEENICFILKIYYLSLQIWSDKKVDKFFIVQQQINCYSSS